MNGKSIEVDNTDAEGRLILSGSPFLHLFPDLAPTDTLQMPSITLEQSTNHTP